ncbi:MAG: hypothetical protein M1814_000067 [Vezdaea aestivalis]|nr:MAG: hypothetical protein M1814_000067 [Vezdaea aestivalis]
MTQEIAVRNIDSHVGKRRRLNRNPDPGITRRRPGIFVPYRTIGLVSPTSVPFSSIPLGKTTFQITTSVGDCLHTYDLQRGLNLTFLTRPRTPGEIGAISAWKASVLAAWSDSTNNAHGVWIYTRGKKVGQLAATEPPLESVLSLCIFGSWIVAVSFSTVFVWQSSDFEFYTSFASPGQRDGPQSYTRNLCHVPTILDKIFLGRSDGVVDILNVKTGKAIYSILPPYPKAGAVTTLEPAPAHGLVAIAYENGKIVIHNVFRDTMVLQFEMNTSAGPVNSLSFRTDGLGAGNDGKVAGVMATCNSNDGDVTLWDLNEGGHVMGILRGAYKAPSQGSSKRGLTKVQFLPGQSILLTGGQDNSLRSWIFDETPFSPIPRLLHSRAGHGDLITTVKFLPADTEGDSIDGKWLITGSLDRSFWAWSLRRDGQSTEFSQGAGKKKQAKKKGLMNGRAIQAKEIRFLETTRTSPVKCMAASLNRDGGMGAAPGIKTIWNNNTARSRGTDTSTTGSTGWESVVTGHFNDKTARTWFWGRKRAGRWTLPTSDGGNVESVEISPCGTFAIIGSSLGVIDCYNLQSGQYRQRFPKKLTKSLAQTVQEQSSSRRAAIAAYNESIGPGKGRHMGAVTGLAIDSSNKSMFSCSADGKLKFWHFKNGLLYDELKWPSCHSITQARFHSPSNILAINCDDLSIRLVDVETRKVVRDLHGFDKPPQDFCFSPDGRWIVSAHDRIIRVWDIPTSHVIDAMRLSASCTALAFSPTGEFLATVANDSLGVNIWNNRSLFAQISTQQISEQDIACINTNDVGASYLLEAAYEEVEEANPDDRNNSVEQLSSQIETLSMVPKARWQTLLHLDLIRERNKPKEPPKVPEKAPFFLGALRKEKSDEEETRAAIAEHSRIVKVDRQQGTFSALLREGFHPNQYDAAITYLKDLSPAAADLEISSLNETELELFVQALTSRLKEKKDYELVQAWMNVLLRLHGDQVDFTSLAEWQDEQRKEAARLAALSGYCSGVVGFFRSGRN